jgi:hypothetical protein
MTAGIWLLAAKITQLKYGMSIQIKHVIYCKGTAMALLRLHTHLTVTIWLLEAMIKRSGFGHVLLGIEKSLR